MNDERIQELMNKAIDKTIAADESEELSASLKNDSKLRLSFEQLNKSSELITSLPEYEPSPNIKKNILNAIDIIEADKVKMNIHKKISLSNYLLVFKPKIVIPVVFALFIGFCIILYWNSSDRTINNKETVSGFMGKSKLMIDNASQIYGTDLVAIKTSLGIFQKRDTLMVVMDKKSAENISIAYNFEPSFVSFLGVKKNLAVLPLIKQADGRASVTIPDTSKVLMMFQVLKPASKMDLQIRDLDREIFRYKFTVNKEIK